MEFTNEIYFNDKLVENKTAKINYNGRLVREGSNEITMVYGFGSNWEHTQEKAMNKSNNGFETEIKIEQFDTLNFCFRNENYNWDNNNSFNYISPIEKQEEISNIVEESTTEKEIENKEENLSNAQLELNNLENEISLLFDELFSLPDDNVQTIEQQSKKTITPSFIPYKEEKTESKTNNFDLDALIEEILSPVIANSDSATTLIENVVPKIEEPVTLEFKDDEISNFPTHVQKTSALVEDILVPYYQNTQEQSLNNKEANFDLDNLIENLSTQTEEIKETPVTPSFSKIENIEELFEQSPVVETVTENINKIETNEVSVQEKKKDFTIIEDEETEEFINEPSLLEEVVHQKNDSRVEENVALSVVKSEQNDLLISPRKLNKFYFLKKKVKLAFYKALVAVPKFLQKQFNSSDNN